jgi:3-deoxy-D-manno-octulosonic-acid transferase
VSLLIYRLFLYVYPVALKLVAPWNSKARRWLQGRSGLMERIKSSMQHHAGKVVWMHCASLGEFEQGRPVLEQLRAAYPQYKYVLTFFSPSGFEAAQHYKGADHVFYLPMDSREHARQLCAILDPVLVLWIKYDYWYYYMHELRHRKVPLLLLSGIFRRSQAFFRWYGGIQRKMLHCVTHFFVQNEHSQHLLQTLGLVNVTVSGDTRFDRVIAIAEKAGTVPGIDEFCGTHPVVVAGSTWQEDEEELDHFANTHSDIRFIIAPHEVEEARLLEVEKLFKRTVRYSRIVRREASDGRRETPDGRRQTEDGSREASGVRHDNQSPVSHLPPDVSRLPSHDSRSTSNEPNVLIIDNIGLLSRLYRYATITWVGGGFGSDGVHNVLEAAVYGKPVVFGPVYDKYLEAVELVGSGGGFSVENALEAETLFTSLLIDKEEYDLACEASREYVYAKKGATERIVAYIQENRLLTN